MPLTDAKVRALKAASHQYKASDTEGLYFLVSPTVVYELKGDGFTFTKKIVSELPSEEQLNGYLGRTPKVAPKTTKKKIGSAKHEARVSLAAMSRAVR